MKTFSLAALLICTFRERLTGDPAMDIDSASIESWRPPFSDEPLTDAKRREILDNICRAAERLGITYVIRLARAIGSGNLMALLRQSSGGCPFSTHDIGTETCSARRSRYLRLQKGRALLCDERLFLIVAHSNNFVGPECGARFFQLINGIEG
ncbi:MAG: hypothetical protein DMF76_20520 [Acidobacteria bacterium]|nr:MAG: hypothetical protein DMF76_20520 [Acidobacteriota bacterium]